MSNSLQSKVILGLILVIGCFGVAYFFTTPQWSRYSAAKANLERKQTEKEQLTTALNSMQTFISQFNGQKDNLEKVNLALPAKSADLPNLLTSLSALAQASGMTLSNFTIAESSSSDKPAPVNSIQTAKINLTASGSFESFKDFIIRLETDLRLIDIENVTLKAENEQIQYVINLRTYYQK